MDSGQDLPGALGLDACFLYYHTRRVYAELMLRKVQKIESDGESRPQAGRAPLLCTPTVLFFFLEDGGTRQRFKSLRDFTLPWGKELW